MRTILSNNSIKELETSLAELNNKIIQNREENNMLNKFIGKWHRNLVKYYRNEIGILYSLEGLSLPTRKQLLAIEYIEDNLHIYFKGRTFEEASKFIERYYDSSKEVRGNKFKEGVRNV